MAWLISFLGALVFLWFDTKPKAVARVGCGLSYRYYGLCPECGVSGGYCGGGSGPQEPKYVKCSCGHRYLLPFDGKKAMERQYRKQLMLLFFWLYLVWLHRVS